MHDPSTGCIQRDQLLRGGASAGRGLEVRLFADYVSGIQDLGDACELAWFGGVGDVAEWGVRASGTGGTGWVGWRVDAGGRARVGGEEGRRGVGGDALGLWLAHLL